ncbi:DNA internalization-related competence protein ComEC/Rec2 [Lysinibacillus fusiformis]|uniref:DNA internalization-related competence protein ComEC/Rec2 n=1 Tax=Lysinibacillus fusiformis TaxID=28031 RepID=UPI001968127F|nr:DNA internalization-related competence protein ComEC/Rec2 [Lysinibacillus fusiformis]QSB10260.1 DNA internalization-related competence protein ComEC/Rec2 [Lysinibacillus fusiformis]
MVALAVLVAAIAAHKSVWLLIFLLLLALWLIIKGESRFLAIFVLTSGLLAYFFLSINQLTEPPPLPSNFPLTWSNDYKINGQKLRGFATTTNGQKLYVVYTFSSEQEKNFYEHTSLSGMTYVAKGELVTPSSPAHAYAFSMSNYLTSKGATGVVEIANWRYVGKRASFFTLLAEVRHGMKKHIERTFPKSLVAEAQALLIGVQDQMEDELQRAYQKLGITHLFAISGLHVALVSWLFFEGLLRISVRKEMATVVLLILLPVYGVIAGGAPSVWRAVSVVELMMLLRFFKWGISMDDALAISFIGFVLLEPGIIFQIGFQLSYLAAASLIYSSIIFKQTRNWLSRSFFITFVCQLLVYPLLLHHFYELSISSFFVNIVFVSLFSFVILPFNIVAFVLSYLSLPLANVLFAGYEPLRNWLTEMIFYMQALPWQLWSPGKPSSWLSCVAMLSVLASFYYLEIRRFRKAIMVLVIPAIWVHLSPMLYNETKITFLNAGQGDSIVIELPFRRAVYVIDAGGVLRFEQESWKKTDRPYEVGKQVVVPFLKGKGIRTIDIFIASHADADHIEGAEEVLQEINMKEIHVTPGSLNEPLMNDLLQEANKRNIPIKEKIKGNAWRVGVTDFYYLWPNDTFYEGNDDSLVLYMRQKAFTALFTGDLEQYGEQQLIKRYGPLLTNLTLLKAGHHGSKTSSIEAFVELLQPQLTVFSAGLHNRYGHPHEEVVERFVSRNLATWTTGLDGTIEIRIWDNRWSVSK